MSRKIFIFEFVSGGGFSKEKIPTSLLCEGFSMLRSIIADFKKLNFDIATLLDIRIKFFSSLLDSDSIKIIGRNEDFLREFKNLVKKSEFCFIIAPEFSQILRDLTEIINKSGKKLLSVGNKGIEIASSKLNTYKFFKANQLPTPETYLIPNNNGYPDDSELLKLSKKFKFPMLIKPDDGVGAESIYYFSSQSELENFIEVKKVSLEYKRRYILQEFILGRDLSILILNNQSLIDKKKPPVILSVNSQEIQIKGSGGNSEYSGGMIPFEENDILNEKINNLLENIDFQNFIGIFGIDFLFDDTINFIEINPRLTTSYIGLRYVFNVNPMELLLKSRKESINIKDLEMIRHSIFRRVELEYNGKQSPKELRKNVVPNILKIFPTEFITPPFSLDKERKHYSCFLATKEKSKEGSLKRLNKIYSYLNEEGFSIC
ncbi:MAG: ATP-grasp domain-containing protein [Promethearchaeota archaeon]|nr:MAG: ATP-grasp domain-containing protein [Candidatus Lokiarchaeota archaeon]